MGIPLKDLQAGMWWVRRVTRGQVTENAAGKLESSCRVKVGILSVWGGAPFFDAQVQWLEAENGRGDRGPRSLSGTPEKQAEFCSPENMKDLEVLCRVVCPWAMGWLDGQDAVDTLGGGVLVEAGYSAWWATPRPEKLLLQKALVDFAPTRQLLAFTPDYERPPEQFTMPPLSEESFAEMHDRTIGGGKYWQLPSGSRLADQIAAELPELSSIEETKLRQERILRACGDDKAKVALTKQEEDFVNAWRAKFRKIVAATTFTPPELPYHELKFDPANPTLKLTPEQAALANELSRQFKSWAYDPDSAGLKPLEPMHDKVDLDWLLKTLQPWQLHAAGLITNGEYEDMIRKGTTVELPEVNRDELIAKLKESANKLVNTKKTLVDPAPEVHFIKLTPEQEADAATMRATIERIEKMGYVNVGKYWQLPPKKPLEPTVQKNYVAGNLDAMSGGSDLPPHWSRMRDEANARNEKLEKMKEQVAAEFDEESRLTEDEYEAVVKAAEDISLKYASSSGMIGQHSAFMRIFKEKMRAITMRPEENMVANAAKGLVIDPDKPPIPIKTYSGCYTPPADDQAWRKLLRYEDQADGRYVVGAHEIMDDNTERFWQLDASTMEWICTPQRQLDRARTFARKFEAKAAINACKKPPFMVQS